MSSPDNAERLRKAMDFPHHRDELLKGSAISEEVILARGYETVKTKAHLDRLGFARPQQRVSALLIPRYSPAGEEIPPQIKPDSPRYDEDSGKAFKYETPKGSRPRLSVHPSMVAKMKEKEASLWVTEGDKKVDALATRNQPCVGLQGVDCWNVPEDWEEIKLAGRKVIVAFDGDVSTKPKVQSALASLVEFLRGRGARAEILYLPDGLGIDDFLAIQPGTPEEGLLAARRYLEEDLREDLAEVGKPLAEVKPEEVRWLWPRRIPKGKITVLDGDPDNGKSVLTTDLVARVSAGEPLADGTPVEAAGGVIVSAEDGAADTIRPRFDAAGGDASKVLLMGEDEDFVIPADIPKLERAINQVDAQLVIIDPLMAFLPSDVNANSDQDMRRVLRPLKVMAERTGASIVIVRHLNKAPGGNPLYRGGGSIGIIGAARSGLVVGKHPDNDELRVLAGQKNNLCLPPTSLSYSIESASNNSARIKYQGSSEMNASELLKTPADEEEKSAIDEAKDFIREALDGKDMAASQMLGDARANGISEKTLKRAKRQLRVESDQSTGGWVWKALDRKSDASSGGPWPPWPSGPKGQEVKFGPLGPLPIHLTTTTIIKGIGKGRGTSGPGGQGSTDRPLSDEVAPGQSAYISDLDESKNGAGGQREPLDDDDDDEVRV